MYIQEIDGIQIRVKQPFDFGFLREYGRVFRVFDSQSSGNLCFGLEKGGKKYFLKFAGAKTIQDHDLPPEDAVARLKMAAVKYRELAHPDLITLLDGAEAGGGYALLFSWEEGQSIGSLNEAGQERFYTLPAKERARVFECILQFHIYAATRGYVAVDFNDNSLLYDFATGSVKLCDIDFYAKQCYMNGTGRIFGIEELMAPEEYRCAGLLDEVTNVYTMGAAAFLLLTRGDRTREAWPLGERRYAVVKKAVSEPRAARQQTLRQLLEQWQTASKKAKE